MNLLTGASLLELAKSIYQGGQNKSKCPIWRNKESSRCGKEVARRNSTFVFLFVSVCDSFFLKVSRDNSVRIADVGLAKAVEDIRGTVTGTIVYMAPEVLHGRAYDSKADIYSLGIMLWEMWCGKRAFADMNINNITQFDQFRKLVDDGCRPKHLEGCEKLRIPIRWESVVTQCWEENPESRPTAAVCATEMRMQQMELDEAVCSISIGWKELEWKEDASSSFSHRVAGQIFQGIRKGTDDVQTAVTLKLCREGFEAINAKETVIKQLR